MSQELALVRDNNLFGYINNKGKRAIEFTFFDAEVFADNDLAPIRIGKLWGFVNRDGKVVIAPEYLISVGLSLDFFKGIKQKGFINDLARVKKNKRWGFIKEDGTVLNKWFRNAEFFIEVK